MSLIVCSRDRFHSSHYNSIQNSRILPSVAAEWAAGRKLENIFEATKIAKEARNDLKRKAHDAGNRSGELVEIGA